MTASHITRGNVIGEVAAHPCWRTPDAIEGLNEKISAERDAGVVFVRVLSLDPAPPTTSTLTRPGVCPMIGRITEAALPGWLRVLPETIW
jgi:hypothetical protein